MPKLATVLRDEIRRLARREIKNDTSALKKASAQYRRDIASLKRELRDAQKVISNMKAQLARKSTVHVDDGADGQGHRFSARSVKAHRARLGLSAAEFGKLLGVSGQTIYQWEQGKARPRETAFAALIQLRALGKRDALTRLTGTEASRRNARRGAGSRSMAPPKAELVRMLRTAKGNVSFIAREQDKAPNQIYRWLKHYDLEPASYR